jgi:hypothetical protein
MSENRFHVREFFQHAGAIGVAAAVAAAAFSLSARADEDHQDGVVGSWLETITGDFPDFQVLITYDEGGGMVATASIDMAAGLKSSPTHGAWARTGRRTFSWTGHAFSFDDAGNWNGTYNIKEQVTLAGTGNAYSGTCTFEVVNGPGAFPLTPCNVTAVRIMEPR